MNLLETGDQQVNAECDPYLGSHCVFARPEESFDSQILLDPFKEKFDLPSPFVDSCDCQRRQIEVVRQEDETFPCICIEETDTPKESRRNNFPFRSRSYMVLECLFHPKKVFVIDSPRYRLT